MRLFTVLLVTTTLFLCHGTCKAQVALDLVVNVGHDVSTPDNDLTLREAIEEAQSLTFEPVTIGFASGVNEVVLSQTATYQSTGVLPQQYTIGRPLDVKSSIIIVGNPSGLILRPVNGNSESIADIDRRAIVIHDGFHCTISNLTIKDFHSDEDTAQLMNDPDVVWPGEAPKEFFEHGAAISNWGTLTLNEVVFQDNKTSNSGGAVYNGATMTATNCVFENNRAGMVATSDEDLRASQPSGVGGAIYSHDTDQVIGDSVLTVLNCTFRDNQAFSNNGGGAIYSANHAFSPAACFEDPDGTAVLNVNNSFFVGNEAKAGSGGAIYAFRSGFEIDKCVFRENEGATIDILNNSENVVRYERGGAIYTRAAQNCWEQGVKTHISNSTFDQNRARQGGAVFFYRDSESKIKSCTFHGNLATKRGGAIFYLQLDGEAEIFDTTIVANHNSLTGGDASGGVFAHGPTANNNNPFDLVKIKNSIISNNTRTVYPNYDILHSNYHGHYSVQSSYNLVGRADDPGSSNDELPTGPNTVIFDDDAGDAVGPLGYYGGPIVGASIAGSLGDLVQMKTCLPGIEATDSGSTTASSDQRGEPRGVNIMDDMGSVEIQQP